MSNRRNFFARGSGYSANGFLSTYSYNVYSPTSIMFSRGISQPNTRYGSSTYNLGPTQGRINTNYPDTQKMSLIKTHFNYHGNFNLIYNRIYDITISDPTNYPNNLNRYKFITYLKENLLKEFKPESTFPIHVKQAIDVIITNAVLQSKPGISNIQKKTLILNYYNYPQSSRQYELKNKNFSDNFINYVYNSERINYPTSNQTIVKTYLSKNLLRNFNPVSTRSSDVKKNLDSLMKNAFNQRNILSSSSIQTTIATTSVVESQASSEPTESSPSDSDIPETIDDVDFDEELRDTSDQATSVEQPQQPVVQQPIVEQPIVELPVVEQPVEEEETLFSKIDSDGNEIISNQEWNNFMNTFGDGVNGITKNEWNEKMGQYIPEQNDNPIWSFFTR